MAKKLTKKQTMQRTIRLLKVENEQLRRENTQLKRTIKKDKLTGALNRESFEKKFENILHIVTCGFSRKGDKKTLFGYLFIDLNDFKPVNDQGGHLAGDAVLKNIGRALGNMLRDSDVFGRIGGDEFAIIARIRSDEDLAILAQRVKETIARENTTFGDQTWPVTGSVGYTIVKSGDSLEAVVDRADQAMYADKKKHKS